MTPEQLVASIQAKKQQEADAPDPDQEFAREQFAQVVRSIQDSNKALVGFFLKYSPDVNVKNFPKYPEMPKLDNSDVVRAIQSIEFPEDDDTDIVAALNGLETLQKQQNALIAKLDLKPEVTVEAPILKVDAPDFKPVIKAIKESKPEPVSIDFSILQKLMQDNLKATQAVQKAVKDLVFPVSNTPTDPLIYYLPADIDDIAGSTGVQYYGYTDNRGAWYIRKMDNSVAPKTIRLVFGQSGYTAAWTNRATQTYSVWGS